MIASDSLPNEAIAGRMARQTSVSRFSLESDRHSATSCNPADQLDGFVRLAFNALG
jgi:hypothetical protein